MRTHRHNSCDSAPFFILSCISEWKGRKRKYAGQTFIDLHAKRRALSKPDCGLQIQYTWAFYKSKLTGSHNPTAGSVSDGVSVSFFLTVIWHLKLDFFSTTPLFCCSWTIRNLTVTWKEALLEPTLDSRVFQAHGQPAQADVTVQEWTLLKRDPLNLHGKSNWRSRVLKMSKWTEMLVWHPKKGRILNKTPILNIPTWRV